MGVSSQARFGKGKTDVILFQVFSTNKKLRMPGFGVNYLASSLQSAGIGAKVLNTLQYYAEGKQDEMILQRIRNYDPSIVGISSISFTNKELVRISELVKKNNPHILTVVGGYGPTNKRDLVKSLGIDVLVYGEGESTLREITEEWLEGNRDLSRVRGIVYKKGSEVVSTEPRDLEANLDLFPFPDREIVDDSPLNRKNILITARGCPFTCSFCAIPKFYSSGKRWRERTTKNIVDELLILADKKDLSSYVEFYDDEFLIRGERLDEILEEMGRYPSLKDLKIAFAARADSIIRHGAQIEKNMGKIQEIFCGIETFNEDYLSKLNKGANGAQALDTNVQVVEFLQKNRIPAKYGFIVPPQAPNAAYLRDHLPIRFTKRINLSDLVMRFTSLNNYEVPFDSEEGDPRIILSEVTKRYIQIMDHFERCLRRNIRGKIVPAEKFISFFNCALSYAETGNKEQYAMAEKMFGDTA